MSIILDAAVANGDTAPTAQWVTTILTDTPCPECGNTPTSPVLWEVTQHNDGSVTVEEYVTCESGPLPGSPIWGYGCGRTLTVHEYTQTGQAA